MNPDNTERQPVSSQDGLPEVLQAKWARDQVLQWFDDLSRGADIQHVQLKSIGTAAGTTLADAMAAFVAGQARAIQVRYRFDGDSWCDTVLAGHSMSTIVRTRLASP